MKTQKEIEEDEICEKHNRKLTLSKRCGNYCIDCVYEDWLKEEKEPKRLHPLYLKGFQKSQEMMREEIKRLKEEENDYWIKTGNNKTATWVFNKLLSKIGGKE